MKVETLNRYTVVDFESPSANHICSVGLVAVENGKIVKEYAALVNPKCEFNYRTIKIHGITPKMVRHMPAFPDIWQEIAPYFTDTVLVAHNAIGDMKKLEFTLARYRMDIPDFFYICTEKLSHKYLSESSHFSLGSLCEYAGIPAEDAHQALADARSCHALFNYLRRFITDYNEEVSLFGGEKALRLAKPSEESPASRFTKLVQMPGYHMNLRLGKEDGKGGFSCTVTSRGEQIAFATASRKSTARQRACADALLRVEADISAKVEGVLARCK